MTTIHEPSPVEELAMLLLDYLPGPGPGYPIVPASFQGIAEDLDLKEHWKGHMKAQSIKSLLDGTLKSAPDKFPYLLLKIIEHSRAMRGSKNAMTQVDLRDILECLNKMNLSIPELEADEFFAELPKGESMVRATQAMQIVPMADFNSRMRKDLISLSMLPDEERGYALELFLNKLFANSDLKQLAPFRQQEKQVSGKLRLGKFNAVLFAFWQHEYSADEIKAIIESIPEDSKCILISLPGFNDDAKDFIVKLKKQNLLAIDLRDIFLVLDGGANLEQMIGLKLKAAEKGKSYVPTQDMLWG